MKIEINKCFKLETNNGDVYNIPYDEAKELYVELQKEFGNLSQPFLPLNYPPNVRLDTTFSSYGK